MATADKLCNNNKRAASIEMTDRRATNLESNLIKSETIKRTLEGLVNSSNHNNKDEKVDVSPEISNKSPNSNSGGDEQGKVAAMNKSFSMYTFGTTKGDSVDDDRPADEDNSESPSKTIDPSKATAFVIDFGSSGGGKASEQRHKHMLERFQNRHRRGVSLSKVEDEMNDSSSSSQLTAKLKASSSPAASAKTQRKLSTSQDVVAPSSSPQAKPSSAGVRLRERSKTSQVRETTNKRHSWSPRTSMVESVQHHNQLPKQQQPMVRKQQQNPLERPLKLHALSRADVKPLPPQTLNLTALRCLQTPLVDSRLAQDDQVSEAGTYTVEGDNYTEEQKAKMNIDNLNHLHLDDDEDSELLRRKLEINESDLEVIDLDPSPARTAHTAARQSSKSAAAEARKNILEVSFYHHEQPPSSAGPATTASSKSKASYLDKLKTRVKSSLIHKAKSPESDVGKFTSVTTSGVLSVKPTLELNPKLKRKNSLTKSQIDSSEYIQQGRSRREQKSAQKVAPVTDSDKSSIASAYQLNIFPAAQQSSPAKSRKESVTSSSTSISTAATKDDWIQEWARNAREYSSAGKHRTPHNNTTAMSSSFSVESRGDDQFGYFVDDADVMSKSDCKPSPYDEFGDNLERYHQKTSAHHHKKKSSSAETGANNLNSAHSSVSSARGRKILRELDHKDDMMRQQQHSLPSSNFNIKPPISPCRIPSPIGTVSHRKKRYGSSAMLYGSDTDLANDTDLYLQRTAAAISTLQNIQRRNSLRNSSLQNSPVSPLSPTRPPLSAQPPARPATAINAAAIRSQSATRSAAIHKRNSSLDSTRYAPNNSQLLQTMMSTSLHNHHQHLAQAIANEKQQQSPYNSYEGMQQRTSSSKFSLQFDQTDDDDEYESMPQPRRARELSERPHQSIKQQPKQYQHKSSSSPIKRSSSFNMKPPETSSPARATTAPAQHKVNSNNQFTSSSSKPLSAPANGSRIQKSASSSCFVGRQVTRHQPDDDDDYESEFYINDDDDLNPNQFTPSDCSEEDEQQKLSLPTSDNTAPLQTRYVNKTFLMRCEQTKKANSNNNAAGLKPIGAVACPNTPEMPRRNVNSAGRDRSSMHRDLSLNRLQERKQQLTLSTNSTPTAKATTPTAASTGSTKVTSKYLDISKYKSDKGGNFLKRDESKSYLVNREVKKSSSSACLQSFQRDNNRASQRSSSSRPSSATTASGKKKEVKNSKELELAMWKRRASYDPLKAAAEGKKKADEAKKMLQQQQMMMSTDSNSSAMRSSKSFHAGTANTWINNESDSEYDDEN